VGSIIGATLLLSIREFAKIHRDAAASAPATFDLVYRIRSEASSRRPNGFSAWHFRN
jgi:hypothetical protein